MLHISNYDAKISNVGFSFSKKEIKWRIKELEATPWIFRDRDTKGLIGLRLRVAELANTISRVLWRKKSPESIGQKNSLSPHLFDEHEPDHELELRHRRLIEFMTGSSVDEQAKDRILVDISSTLRSDYLSGIQRVCWEFCAGAADHNVVPFFLYDDQLFAYCRQSSTIQPIEIRENETCFWMDASWGYWQMVSGVMARLKERGGTNIVMVYDLVPMIYPQFTVRGLQDEFARWFDNCVSRSDVVICISRAVAIDTIKYLSKLSYHNVERIGWSHLGCDLPVIDGCKPDDLIKSFCLANKKIFLTVGTIEPRKGHLVALDAFNQLWAEGKDAFYVIVGRYGWNAETIRQKITNNPEYGKRLIWWESATDADLLYLYENARALVYPSITEGFGLPCVEAASKGCPVIASDIPVFREIGGDEFAYFELCNSESLAARISEALESDKKSPAIPILSWKGSAQKTIQMIRDNSYQYSADHFGRFTLNDSQPE